MLREIRSRFEHGNEWQLYAGARAENGREMSYIQDPLRVTSLMRSKLLTVPDFNAAYVPATGFNGTLGRLAEYSTRLVLGIYLFLGAKAVTRFWRQLRGFAD